MSTPFRNALACVQPVSDNKEMNCALQMKKVNANEPEGTASKFSGDRERGTGSKWVKVLV